MSVDWLVGVGEDRKTSYGHQLKKTVDNQLITNGGVIFLGEQRESTFIGVRQTIFVYKTLSEDIFGNNVIVIYFHYAAKVFFCGNRCGSSR